MPPMKSRMLRRTPIISGLVLLAVAGCGSDDTVTRDEAVAALRETGLHVSYREVPKPAGTKGAIAGRAVDGGTAVDFVLLFGRRDPPSSDQEPVLPGDPGSGGTQVANTWVLTNARGDAGQDLAIKIESALQSKAPDAPDGP
jgi:hypothetical protein